MFNNIKKVSFARLLCAGTLFLPLLLAGCGSQQSAAIAGHAAAPSVTPTKASAPWVLPSEIENESSPVSEPVVETAGVQLPQTGSEGIEDPLSMVNAYFDALNAGDIDEAFNYINVERTERKQSFCNSGYLDSCLDIPFINPEATVIPHAIAVTGPVNVTGGTGIEGDYYDIELDDSNSYSAWLVENNGWKLSSGALVPLEFSLPPKWRDVLSDDTAFSINGVVIPFQDGEKLGESLIALTLIFSYYYPAKEVTVDVSHGDVTVPITFVKDSFSIVITPQTRVFYRYLGLIEKGIEMSEFNAENGSGLSLGTVVDGAVTGARKGITATKQAATDNGFGRAWMAFRSDPEAKLPADYEDNVWASLDSETESVKHKLDGGLTTTKQFANNSKRRFGAAWEELTSKGKMALVGMVAVLLVFVGIVPSHASNNPAKAGEQYWSAFYQRDAKKVCSIGYRSLNFTSYDRCVNAVPARLAGLSEEQRSYLKDQRCKTVFKEAKSAEVECHGNYDWDVAYLGLERQGRKWFVIAN